MRELAAGSPAGSNVVVAGPRRSGKTSVCDAALVRLGKRGFYRQPRSVRIARVAEFAEALVTSTIANRSALRRVIHQTRGRGGSSRCLQTGGREVQGSARRGARDRFSPGLAARDPERYLDYALALPGRIAETDACRRWFSSMNSRRSAAQTSRMAMRTGDQADASDLSAPTEVSYLFAGSLEHLMRDLFTPSDRALHQFGGFRELRPIDAEAWLAGLSERFAADDCEARPGCACANDRVRRGTTPKHDVVAQKAHLTTVELDTGWSTSRSSSRGCWRRWRPTVSRTSRSSTNPQISQARAGDRRADRQRSTGLPRSRPRRGALRARGTAGRWNHRKPQQAAASGACRIRCCADTSRQESRRSY